MTSQLETGDRNKTEEECQHSSLKLMSWSGFITFSRKSSCLGSGQGLDLRCCCPYPLVFVSC